MIKKSIFETLLLENTFETNGIQESGGGDKGKQYEIEIFNSIAGANFNGLSLQGLYSDPAGNDSSRADADFVLPVRNNKKIDGIVGPINVEAKLNRAAQLGGTSFSIAGATPEQIKVIKDASGMDNKVIDSIKNLISKWFIKSGPGKSAAWDNLFKFIIQKEKQLGNIPPEKKFPLNCSKEAWAEAQANNLIAPLNAKIEADVTIWTKFYNNKNVYYVQFGPDVQRDGAPSGGGLYCLGPRDPYGLRKVGVSVIDSKSLSKIKATYTIEIRPGAGGSKGGRRGIGIRAQGRLKFKPKTNLPATQHTLDSTSGVLKLAQEYFNAYDVYNLPVDSYWASREDMLEGVAEEMKVKGNIKEHTMKSNLKNVLSYLFEETEAESIGSEIDMIELDHIDVIEGTGSEIENAPEFTPTEQESNQ